MTKKIIWIILILLIVLAVGYSIYWLIFRTCYGPRPVQIKDNTAKEQRLADPNLLYFSSWWAGLCSNEKQERGGCYRELYLYSDGKFIKMPGFIKYNEEDRREEEPNVQDQLSPAAMEKIQKIIRDSGVMAKDCPMGQIMDAGWDYQINLDGVKKSFRNPPENCRDAFNVIDDTFDQPIK